MANLLEGKVAIVTGAGRGIGKGEAILLAQEGAKVVVNDHGGGFDGAGKGSDPAQQVVEEIRAFGGEAIPNFADVSSFAETKVLIDTAINKFGKLNILVNNAGIVRDRMIFNMTEEEFDKVIVYWREQHKAGNILNGAIVNTTSDAGLLGNPSQSNYGGAKAAIAAMTIIVALEMARYDVRCNCIAPAARTRLSTDATPSLKPLVDKPVAPGEFDFMAPENMAPLVAYLASDDAKDVNGEVFRIMGDRIWFLRGWHNVDTVAKGKARWAPEELGPVIKKMVEKAPPKEDLTSPYKDVGSAW